MVRSVLTAIGLGAVLCLPCLWALGAGALAAGAAGAVMAAARDPWVGITAGVLLAMGAGVTLRSLGRRARCGLWQSRCVTR